MAKTETLARKAEQIEALGKILSSNGVYLFDYRGMTVKQMEALRVKIKAQTGDVEVIKNRLAIQYFKSVNLPYGRDLFNGTLAVAYSHDKYVDVARELVDHEKDAKNIKIRYGFLEQTFVGREKIDAVAKLPSREVLLGQFAGSMASPLKKWGRCMSSPLTSMLVLMKNLKDKKAQEGEA